VGGREAGVTIIGWVQHTLCSYHSYDDTVRSPDDTGISHVFRLDLYIVSLMDDTYRVGKNVSCCTASRNFVNYGPI